MAQVKLYDTTLRDGIQRAYDDFRRSESNLRETAATA